MSNDISNYNNWLDAWNDFYEKEKELVELDPNAALVSSVDAEGNPNARVILIKDVRVESQMQRVTEVVIKNQEKQE